MQKNDLTKLALKLAGIYILVQAILYIPVIVPVLRMSSKNKGQMEFFLPLIITFILLVILGTWLTLKNKPKFEDTKANSSDLLVTGITIAGIIIFVLAIAQLPLILGKLIFTITINDPIKVMGADTMLDSSMKLVGNLVLLLIGAALFFKAKFFTKLIK